MAALVSILVTLLAVLALFIYVKRQQAKEMAKRDALKIKQSAEQAAGRLMDKAQAEEEKAFHHIRDKI